MGVINIAWLEDESIIVDAFRDKFAEYEDLELVVVEHTFDAFCQAVQEVPSVQVAVLDIGLDFGRPETGMDAIPVVRKAHPGVRIAVMSNYLLDHSAFLGLAFDKGVNGFLAKRDGRDEIIAKIRSLGEGEAQVATSSLRETLPGLMERDVEPWHWFTEKQRALLTQLARSRAITRNEFIAESTFSARAVENHFGAIKDKLLAAGELQRTSGGDPPDMRWEWLRRWAQDKRFDLRSPR